MCDNTTSESIVARHAQRHSSACFDGACLFGMYPETLTTWQLFSGASSVSHDVATRARRCSPHFNVLYCTYLGGHA